MIREAVAEERNAEATYRNVIATLGDIQPFVTIASSEAQHVAALEQLAANRGVDITDIRPVGAVSPTAKRAACDAGVTAEMADIALYDRLLPQVAGDQEATRVFENLRSASLGNHLPAFQRCA